LRSTILALCKTQVSKNGICALDEAAGLRMLFSQHNTPKSIPKSLVITERRRLRNAKESFDIQALVKPRGSVSNKPLMKMVVKPLHCNQDMIAAWM
jgi:hypothetical protein